MRRTERSHLPIYAATHPGMRGKNNEDRYGVSAYRLRAGRDAPRVVLAVLADGIGGHRAGEVAADMVVENISAFFARQSNGVQPVATLEKALIETSQLIYKQAQSNNGQEGMGATVACALVIEQRLYIASAGDSRIYLLRGKQAIQLTRDHTWIQEALENGLLNEDQVQGHPNSHVIRRFLGSPEPPQVDVRLRLNPDEDDEQTKRNQGMLLQPGDQLLLCSDGLTDLVDADEIGEAFAMMPPDEAVNALVEVANLRGGHDNITLVVLSVPLSGIKRNAGLPRWLRALVTVIAAILLIVVMVAAYLEFNQAVPPLATPTPAASLTPLPIQNTPTPLHTVTSTRPPARTHQPKDTATPNSAATLTPWPTHTRAP